MVKIKIELDELTSTLASYHILCAPTGLNQRFNPDVFANLDVSPEERGNYLSFLLENGATLEKTDSYRSWLFFPECKSLEDLFCSQISVPIEVQENLRAFQKRFKPYIEKVRQKVDPLIESRKKETEEVINRVYDISQEFTGISLERPEELDIRVVEGLAPQSRGSYDKHFILEQTRNFLSEEYNFLLTLIHETVAHDTVRASEKHSKKRFEYYVYDVEEGFVKLFTRKIAERILGHEIDYGPCEGIQEVSYNVFNDNWRLLTPTDFNSWYKNCLREIKQSANT